MSEAAMHLAALPQPDRATINPLPHFAFCGKAGAGKTTAADVLVQNMGYIKLSFAEPLKDVASTIWGESARSDREKLQRLGVAVRDIQEDSWVQLLIRRAQDPAVTYGAQVVVDDMRFVNEHQALREAGFVLVRVRADRGIRVDRLKRNGKLQDEAQLDHVSETAIDQLEMDYTIDNDEGHLDLIEKIVNIVEREVRRT